MRIRTNIFFSMLSLIASIADGQQKAALFQFTERLGQYSVGLKVLEQYDYSRIYRHITNNLGQPYRGERARPLQTLIWYPAEKTATKPMTVDDYCKLLPSETNFDKPTMSLDSEDWVKGMKPTLAMLLWAVRDAPQVSGRFPGGDLRAKLFRHVVGKCRSL